MPAGGAPDDRLALIDQASLLALRSVGHQPLVHLTWLYDRSVDLEALRDLQARLGRSPLLGRLARRSRLPGGRARWVRPPGAAEVEIEPLPRPRSEIDDWVEQVARRGLDPERGPGWRLAVLPLTDGGSAVTLLASHTLVDGVGLNLTVDGAVADRWPRSGYRPAPPVWRTAVGDLAQLAASLPAAGRALVALLAMGAASRGAPTTPAAPAGAAASATYLTVFTGLAEWDACAERLGGTSNTLFCAVAARLARRLGRVDDAGGALLAVPVDERREGDTRGNALSAVRVRADTDEVTRDLAPLRTAIRSALAGLGEHPPAEARALPLVPFLPRWLMRRLALLAAGGDQLAVGCSNLGDLPAAIGLVDGASADRVFRRMPEPGFDAATAARLGGQLFCSSCRYGGELALSVQCLLPAGSPSSAELAGHVAASLADFGLSARPLDEGPLG